MNNLKWGMNVEATLDKITWIGTVIGIDGDHITVTGYPSILGTKTVVVLAENLKKANKKNKNYSLNENCLNQIETIKKNMAGDNKYYKVPASNIIEQAIAEMAERLKI